MRLRQPRIPTVRCAAHVIFAGKKCQWFTARYISFIFAHPVWRSTMISAPVYTFQAPAESRASPAETRPPKPTLNGFRIVFYERGLRVIPRITIVTSGLRYIRARFLVAP